MKIGILSRNANLYSTRRLVEAIEAKGHTAQVIDHLKCDIVIEQDKPTIFYKGENLSGLDAVIPRIGASVTFYGTAVVRQFEMMNIFSAVESQALVRSRDKLRSLQILAKAGVGLPKTVFTNYSKEVNKLIDSVGGAPLIVKLLEGTQGYGVVLAPTKKAAQSMIEAFHSMKARVIVQEFIQESKGADIRVFVVNGKVAGAMKRQGKEGEFRSNLHQGGSGSLIKLSKKEREAALTAAQAMGLPIAGVDMLQSERGPLILEVNSSPGLEGIEKSTGKDIAASIIRYVTSAVETQRNNPTKRRKIKSNA
ncbi:MAG: 30S ribosomal protein S6--L-glutamate ligase [Balneola sp.]|nr:30S ribosomal protein S6--L-glutamate ligase [Balneola sp.]MBO6650703.1 30S ribosomal protein S6--L-glutamate ligase [Balneola sp.]MBO6710615.1 30S ribosomal protein S6--L-glutamate ligase [Balneola sp.]MBO6799301.1 30S ribosomal protein S6--L-glutamate ligase [Balneola sp.]MBO6869570.1 30S ribosomal protein S6--L-glutamate ligase [Balneola sp.]